MLYDDERYSELFAAMREAASKAMKFSSVDLSGLSEMLRRVSLAYTAPDLSPLINTVQRISLAVHSESFMDSLNKLQSLQNFSSPPLVSDELQQSIIRVLRSSGSYMDDYQKAVVDEIDPEILNPSAEPPSVKPRFSAKILYYILTLLIGLMGIIVQRLPNEQLDEIAAQNEEIIALDEELSRQHSEEIALLIQLNETGQKIVDLLDDDAVIGSLFSDEPEALLDGLAESDQVSVDNPEFDADSDSQQDDADAVQ